MPSRCILGYEISPLVLIIFPSEDIESYVLNPDEEFFSNVHQNSDPIIINCVYGLHIHPRKTDEFIGLKGDGWVPNKIRGALLFRKSPLEDVSRYHGFKELIEYDSDFLI